MLLFIEMSELNPDIAQGEPLGSFSFIIDLKVLQLQSNSLQTNMPTIFHFDILTGYVYKGSTCEINIWEN